MTCPGSSCRRIQMSDLKKAELDLLGFDDGCSPSYGVDKLTQIDPKLVVRGPTGAKQEACASYEGRNPVELLPDKCRRKKLKGEGLSSRRGFLTMLSIPQRWISGWN
jgi:hypothetical protein